MTKKQLISKTMLLIAIMVVGVTSAWAATVTYTISSKNTLSITGTAPTGSSATIVETYNQSKQMTKGNSQTLTLKNYNGYKITNLVLSMSSNASSGAGILSYSTDGGKSFTYLVGSASSGVSFNNNSWYGNWSSTYVNIKKAVEVICGSSDVIIKIEATANSLYCKSYSITYEPYIEGYVATPTFSPESGAVAYGTTVTLTQNNAEMIIYTTNGDTPSYENNVGEIYRNPISITSETTIKAIAVDSEGNESEVAEASYSVAAPAVPTFSPTAGGVNAGTTVELTANVNTILYTTDGSTPSYTNNIGEVYTEPITISAPTTIKAIAVDNGGNESEVATAKYTIKVAGQSMTIDFEDEISSYKDWTITNIARSAIITPYDGSFYGRNYATSNASKTASIQTSKKVAYPNTFSCYISKEADNTTTSTWYVQISTDGSTWTDVKTHSATNMAAQTWVAFSADLSNFRNVYVRLYYKGTNSYRCVDDIELTTFDILDQTVPVAIGNAGLATFSSLFPIDFTSASAVEAYTATVTTAGKMTFNRIYKVPANTGLLLRNALGEDQGAVAAVNVPVIDDEEASEVTENALVPVSETINNLPTNDTDNDCTNFILNKVGNNLGFYWANNQKVAAGKAYLRVPNAVAESVRSFSISFDGSTSGIEYIENSFVDNHAYDLQGRRVNSFNKGLYIVNGKKIIKK